MLFEYENFGNGFTSARMDRGCPIFQESSGRGWTRLKGRSATNFPTCWKKGLLLKGKREETSVAESSCPLGGG